MSRGLETRKTGIIAFALIVALAISAIAYGPSLLDYFGGGKEKEVSVGENQLYGVFAGDQRIGSLAFWVPGRDVVENSQVYVARYNLSYARTVESGKLKFDDKGKLLRASTALAENGSLKWSVEVGYSPSEDLMRVIVEDNRVLENYREVDRFVSLGGEGAVMMPEHSWYWLRFQELGPDYRREILLNLLPNPRPGEIEPGMSTRATFLVTGSEEVETEAGEFQCWVVEGRNVKFATWPLDRVWLAKGEGIVVKAIEEQAGTDVTYELQRFSE